MPRGVGGVGWDEMRDANRRHHNQRRVQPERGHRHLFRHLGPLLRGECCSDGARRNTRLPSRNGKYDGFFGGFFWMKRIHSCGSRGLPVGFAEDDDGHNHRQGATSSTLGLQHEPSHISPRAVESSHGLGHPPISDHVSAHFSAPHRRGSGAQLARRLHVDRGAPQLFWEAAYQKQQGGPITGWGGAGPGTSRTRWPLLRGRCPGVGVGDAGRCRTWLHGHLQ